MSTQGGPARRVGLNGAGRGAGVRGGFNPPTRTVTLAGTAPAAAAAATAAASAPNAPAPGVASMATLHPRPQVPWQVIQQIQEFLLQLAWQEVREGPTMTVANQKNAMPPAFNRFADMFLQNAIPAPAGNDCYPTCPDSLRNCDRTAAIALLNQSTSTGRASISKDSMHRKAKFGTRKLLKYMGDWLRVCKDPSTRAGEFTPSAPPSGKNRDYVWDKIKSTEHRSQQCLKIYNLRVQNSHLAENTPEAIAESLTHLNFSRRGYSLEEEMNIRGRFQENALADNDDLALDYNQIMQEVEAGNTGHVAVAESDDEETVPRPAAAASAVAPRGYHESPYDTIAGNYHPFELCFKAFTQYAGHGHADISSFYTAEWAEQRRTQAAAGHVGRTQQRRQHQADLNQGSEPLSSSQSIVSTASTTATSVSQINDLTMEMRLSNAYTRGSQVIANLEKAISVATILNKPACTIQRLREQLFGLLMEDVSRGTDAAPRQPSQQLSPTAPAQQRRRVFDAQQQQAIQQMEELFDIVDNEGEGNCLFYVFEAIEEEYLDSIRRRPRNRRTFEDLRNEVVDVLRASSATIRIASVRDVQGNGIQNVFVEADMASQQGSVREYCDWLSGYGVSGRSVSQSFLLFFFAFFWR